MRKIKSIMDAFRFLSDIYPTKQPFKFNTHDIKNYNIYLVRYIHNKGWEQCSLINDWIEINDPVRWIYANRKNINSKLEDL